MTHNKTKSKERILICAFACDPLAGSESGVGWSWSLAASRNYNVTVITTDDAKDSIENYRKRHNCGNEFRFYYIPRTPLFKFSLKIFFIFPLLFWWNYIYSWQKAAYHLGCKLHKERPFDLIHNLTYVGFRAPGYWYKLNLPFVWGPLGGLEQTNLRLAWALGGKCFFWFLCRNILNWRDKMFCLRAKNGMKAASGAIISATSGIQREIRKYYGEDSAVISEIGMNIQENEDFSPVIRKPNEPLRLIWIGRMYSGKGFEFVLEALAKLPEDVDWLLQAFGDGECRRNWERLANTKGFSSRIQWMGNCPRAEVLDAQKKVHALLISSIYELSCTCAIEALAAGIPSIAPDICGFPESVPDGCGIRFSARAPEEFINGLRNGIIYLYRNESERQSFCRNAKEYAKNFSWERKAEALCQIYRKCLRHKKI